MIILQARKYIMQLKNCIKYVSILALPLHFLMFCNQGCDDITIQHFEEIARLAPLGLDGFNASPAEGHLLQIAARHGLDKHVRALLLHTGKQKWQPTQYAAPHYIAYQSESFDTHMFVVIVYLFLDINPNAAQGTYYPGGCPALLVAVQEGHSKVLEVFVDTKKVNCKTTFNSHINSSFSILRKTNEKIQHLFYSILHLFYLRLFYSVWTPLPQKYDSMSFHRSQEDSQVTGPFFTN